MKGQKEYDRAYLAGVTARQVNRKADRNPYTGKSSLRHLYDAWLAGWQAQDLISRGK